MMRSSSPRPPLPPTDTVPQPRQVSAAADELIRLYREAQDRLIAQYQAIIDGPRRGAQQARIRELIRAVDTEIHTLNAQTSLWASERLPIIFAEGGQHAAGLVGSTFTWHAIHLEAVQKLAETAWSDLLSKTQHVERTTKRALRSLAANATRATVLESQTPVRAAADFADLARADGILTVTYANGAEVAIADYAEMAVRTTSASVFNGGSLSQNRDDGIEWLEVADGPDCGWTEHDDDDLADGSIRSLDEADEFPISHPGCARSFLPRPDLTSADDAADAQPDPDLQLAAANAERARGDTATRTLSGRARTPREPRQPRTPRNA